MAGRAQHLAAREEKHAALVAAGSRQRAARFRLNTRRYCSVYGVPVPPWAVQLRRDKAEPKPKPKRKTKTKEAPAPAAPLPFTPGQPLELPRALREWRAGSPGRAISIASDGTVRLLRAVFEGKQQATFSSLQAAAEAAEPPIKWEPIAIGGATAPGADGA